MSTLTDVANFSINESGATSSVSQPQNINIALSGLNPNVSMMPPAGAQVVVLEEHSQFPNLVVSSVNPGLKVPGIWIQTGLGDGSDFTFWFEDGVL